MPWVPGRWSAPTATKALPCRSSLSIRLHHAAVAVDDQPLLEAADGAGGVIALLGIEDAVDGHQVAGEMRHRAGWRTRSRFGRHPAASSPA